MKLFKSPKAMLAEIAAMESAERYRREDRSLVSEFFNGAPPISDAEAQDLGFTVNVNHLFGYTDLSNAADQMFSTFTKPSHLFTVQIRHADPGKAVEWSMKSQEGATRVLRKMRSFKPQMQGVTGDATLHGEAIFHFVDRTSPLPRQAPLSKFLVPENSSTDPNELTHFAREGEIGLRKLHEIARNESESWNKANVRGALAKLYGKDTDPEGGGMTDNTLDTENLEELEYARQNNSATDTKRKTSWKVYYFYQKRCDLRHQPWGCTILLKSSEDTVSNDAEGQVLYENDECYSEIGNIIHPIFMDCVIGGEMKWHRVLGLGHLNYSLNQSIETLICRAQQATLEGSMNLWEASDTVGRDEMQQILLKHNGIIPQGLSLLQNRFQPNFGGILEMIQFYRQQGSKNARGVTPNNGDNNDQLEVQAQFEMNQSASISNNRSQNFYSALDPMWEEVWARLTCPCGLEPEDPGYSAIKDFQDEMESEGIPLYRLQPHNVTIEATRLVGDGLRAKELSIANFLTTNRQMFVPEVQPRITRLVTAIAFDNYRLAEEFTPLQEVPDDPQNMRAQAENSAMLTQRVPQTPKADDIDAIHIVQHFPAMEILVSDGLQYQKAAFTPQQAQSFQLIGKHIALHIQRIEAQAMNVSNDENRNMARQFMEQLTQVAAMGDKLLKNMQQMQESGQQEEMDPVEMAKLQLEVEKLQFNRQKLAINSQMKDRQLSAREQQQAFEQQMRLTDNFRKEREHRQTLAMNDVNTSLQVSAANSKSGADT